MGWLRRRKKSVSDNRKNLVHYKHTKPGGLGRIQKWSLYIGLQFFVSIILIISVFVVYKQLQYALKKDLGFEKENILFIADSAIPGRKDVLKNEMQKVPGVESVSASFGLPALETTRNGYKPEGEEKWMMYNALYVDDDFLDTYKLQIKEGRSFFEDSRSDNDFIINETLARELNWNHPVGKKIYRDGMHEVIGVVKDFHTASIYFKIPPLIISKQYKNDFYALSIRISGENIQQTIGELKKTWETIVPDKEFSWSFLDSRYQTLYNRVTRLGKILAVFTIISILISLLGLTGIVLIISQSFIKEIGIRKVNGARLRDILSLLNGKFAIWIGVAYVVACPVSFYLMRLWLQNFAYKTAISWWVFLASGFLALLVAGITVSIQGWRIAGRNVVDALRYE